MSEPRLAMQAAINKAIEEHTRAVADVCVADGKLVVVPAEELLEKF